MSDPFFDQPILNTPYECPSRHWELKDGQPTQKIIERRRHADFITPIPRPKKQQAAKQQAMDLDDTAALEHEKQKYELSQSINEIRGRVRDWRAIPKPNLWQVTPETQRLLQHWRHHRFSNQRPFFCQIEAVETLIWLTEVAPKVSGGKEVLARLARASREANGDLQRIALKLATGAGKTTVMAMIIAWQTLNAVRSPQSKSFTKGFLLVAPGLTIKDRLRVLQPNDPENYYSTRELVPNDMLPELLKAQIVITNYHAFKLRERTTISAGGKSLLKGRTGSAPETLESEGQMLQRVVESLMGMKNVMVLNDEAHHCYRSKPKDVEEETLKGEDKKEADKNNEAARLWISGLEALHRKLGIARVVDLSATPFFLRGSGYAEGTLFPWTASDFSLMDAIECGIVKLPRVPVAENITGSEMPLYRNLWENIRKDMPKKGRGSGAELDPAMLPARLQTALLALYGHYERTFHHWRASGQKTPPGFIIVCQNTAISKLVYDYVSGYERTAEDGSRIPMPGKLALFRNTDELTGDPLARPNTILIDSEQLEAGDALDANFRTMASDEIEQFRQAMIARGASPEEVRSISDQTLLREVMNTVGKQGQLGAEIRCVVSVSMLTEGWDANNVTHILGIRAFGTQLLCEQVVGRALRRASYEADEETGLFPTEYADIFGVPFDFTAKPVIAPPQPPREAILVRAVRPERDHLEIRFPRVQGYRIELPTERLSANFTSDSVMELTPDLVGPTRTQNSGIIGATEDMNLKHLESVRPSTVLYHLTERLLTTKWRDPDQEVKYHLFGELKRITNQWLRDCLVCKGGTYPAQLLYLELADMACERITAAISQAMQDTEGGSVIKAILDPYNPTGSTAHVRFTTSKGSSPKGMTESSQSSTAHDRSSYSKALLWDTKGPPPKNHINWVILDSDWEAELCAVVEQHPRVLAYTKNHNLGFEVPYRYGPEMRHYRPDFIVLVDDGHGPDDPLRLVVEIKGYRKEDAKDKKLTMETYWIPGVNNLQHYGRWAFAEFTDLYEIESDFKTLVAPRFQALLDRTIQHP